MKKVFAVLLMLGMMVSLAACGGTQAGETEETNVEQSGEKQVAEEYVFELAEGEQKAVENLVFEEDVTVSGDNAQIVFNNCEFKGNIVNTANLGTQVVLSASTIDGQCVFENDTKEATMEVSFPKFLVDAPVDVVCEECIGAVIPLGDFEITFNGEPYTMADSELFVDLTNAEAGFVPYEGQEANYYCVAQWWENGEKVLMVECEYDPNM